MSRFRDYDPETDEEAVIRIWKETGWLQEGKEDNFKDFLKGSSRAMVAELKEQAECLVLNWEGNIKYLDEELPFSCISSVTTSRIARKQGMAGKLTALAMAKDAAEGAHVCGLGMFEQGFYDKLGFGTGSYENWLMFDPATLDIEQKPGVPSRLDNDDWEVVHESRLDRKRGHGSTSLFSPIFTKMELNYRKTSFGLGYYDGSDEKLTHHVYINPEKVDKGPYWVRWLSYETKEEFLELMAIIKSLEDQVRLVGIREPQGIQLQDLLNKPFQYRTITRKSDYENKMRTNAYWQMRILDLKKCMNKTKLDGDPVRFNLKLQDPVEDLLDKDAPWNGISGEYVIKLGNPSEAMEGERRSLPTMKATVNAFSRMWLGVQPASGLYLTDDLEAPVDLLKKLDDKLRLPEPHPDWDF
ncbi:MAG: hypothetical protein ACQESD_02440 [Thermoplasmatota archaeon]